jgi:transposase InsO family protein
VAKFLFNEIVCHYGCPAEVLTDKGSNFNAEILSNYLGNLKVKHLRTTAFHPRTNGLNERFNGVLGGIIRKLCEEKTNNWDLYLEQALFACRVKIHSTTGFSPFELVYGVRPVLPGDIGVPCLQQEVDKKKLAEWAENERLELAEKRALSLARTKRQQQKAKEYFDAEVAKTGENYTVGDLVMLANEAGKKLDRRWTGPYRVLEVKSEDGRLLRLQELQSKKILELVNRERVKRLVVARGPIDNDGYTKP